MVPAALSAETVRDAEWVCLECEELDEERLVGPPVHWIHGRVAEEPSWSAS
jgi:hypothetical protein